jgi:hypothetical protein
MEQVSEIKRKQDLMLNRESTDSMSEDLTGNIRKFSDTIFLKISMFNKILLSLLLLL